MRQFQSSLWALCFAVVSSQAFAQQATPQPPKPGLQPAPQTQQQGVDPLAGTTQPGYPVDPAQPATPATPAQPAPVTPGQQPAPVTPGQQPAPVVGGQPAPVVGVQPAPVVGGQPAPVVGVQPAPVLLLPAAPEMRRIYNLMMATRRFANGVGHTVAASQLAICLPGLTPEQKVQTLMATMSALARSNIPVINEAFAFGIYDDAQVSVIASLLACKAGARTPVQMVQSLGAAYRELLINYNLLDSLYQVEVAVRLMP